MAEYAQSDVSEADPSVVSVSRRLQQDGASVENVDAVVAEVPVAFLGYIFACLSSVSFPIGFSSCSLASKILGWFSDQ